MKKFLVLVLVGFLSACGGQAFHPVSGRGLPKAMPDRDPVRRIILVYPYTKERIDVVFFHDGSYDRRALAKIDKIMRDRHTGVAGKIDPEVVDLLVDMRKRLALPETVPIQVLSGYRSRQTNEELAQTNANVAKESLHIHGWAVDFRIDGVNGKAICEVAKTMQRGGVAYYPQDDHVHVDIGNIRTWRERRR